MNHVDENVQRDDENGRHILDLEYGRGNGNGNGKEGANRYDGSLFRGADRSL